MASTTNRGARESAEWLACMLLASVGLVYCLWVVPYIPTTDGPQHVLSAHIENHYSDPGSLYPEFYRVLPQFAGKGFALLFAPLESVLPWRVALRVTLSLIALAFAWGFALLTLSLDRTRRPTAMLGFLIALPWAMYMGFFQFIVGTTFGLYTLAFLVRRPPTTSARRVVIAVMLLVQGIGHIFSAILTGAVVMVLAVVAAPRGQRLREVGRMALVGTPMAAVLALTFYGRNLRASEQQVFDWSLADRFTEISRWFVPGPAARAWPIVLLGVAGVAATFVRGRRGKSTPTEQAFAWVAVGFFVLTIFAPLHIPGWQFFAQRFCVLPMVLGLALVRFPETVSRRAGRALVPLLAGCCIASDLVSASLHHRLADGCADALAGLDVPLHFEGTRLPLIVDPSCGTPRDSAEGPVPRASLANNIPLLFLVEHGGIGTRMFNGTPSIHAIDFVGTRRPPPPSGRPLAIAQSKWINDDPKLRASVMTELAVDGMPFEGIHVIGGRPDDFALFNTRGYVTEFTRGSTFIARYEGCPAELLLAPDALDGDAVYYEYGLFTQALIAPEPRSFGVRVIRRDLPVIDGRIHVPLVGRPCGEVWVRVFWDVDRSSTFTPGDRTCENARGQGRFRGNVSHDRPTLSCSSPAVTAPVPHGTQAP